MPNLIHNTLRTNSKSTYLEIFDFCENYNLEHFSNQALSAATENLNSEVFEFLNKEFVNDYYEDDYKTYTNLKNKSTPNTEKFWDILLIESNKKLFLENCI